MKTLEMYQSFCLRHGEGCTYSAIGFMKRPLSHLRDATKTAVGRLIVKLGS